MFTSKANTTIKFINRLLWLGEWKRRKRIKREVQHVLCGERRIRICFDDPEDVPSQHWLMFVHISLNWNFSSIWIAIYRLWIHANEPRKKNKKNTFLLLNNISANKSLYLITLYWNRSLNLALQNVRLSSLVQYRVFIVVHFFLFTYFEHVISKR